MVRLGSETPTIGESEIQIRAPAWDVFDKRVLRFYGYFDEMVPESPLEKHRVRRVIILYYLEDDTVSVHEPHEVNSGLSQGTILKRGRIDGLDVESWRVGKTITLCSRVVTLTDLDGFTKDYYHARGVAQPEAIPVPIDAYAEKLERRSDSSWAADLPPLGKKVHVDSHKVMQQLENDRKVCRFFAVVDENNERRHFIILYFLADNSVEIREQFPINAGRDTASVFFRRGRVADSGHPITAGLSKGDEKVIDLKKFSIGACIHLIHKKFFVYDADKFTRDWFSSHFHIELGSRVDISIEEPGAKSIIPTPPYTGYGSWDDSMGSVFALNPKQPKKDLFKLFVNEGKLLRFNCRFANPSVQDKVRRFVLTYYLSDDHVSIHEPPLRNSGIIGGKFLERGVYMNALSGKLLSPQQLTVGREIDIVGRRFIIESCDRYTEKYLENPVDSIKPVTSVVAIANEVRRKLFQMMPMLHDTFRKMDRDGKSTLTIDKFREVLGRFGFILSDNDSLAIMQLFDANQNGQISYLEFCDMVYDDDFFTDKPEHGDLTDQSAGRGFGLVPLNEYRSRTESSLAHRSEQEKAKRAMAEVTELLYSRSAMDQRLLKEIANLANNSHFANSEQLRGAFMNLGHAFDQKDVDRIVGGSMEIGETISRFDYIALVKRIKVNYHKLIV